MAERDAIPRQVERQRLMDLFQRGLAAGHLLINAPAGYGKSVALRQLAARRPDSHLIGLTPADGDPASLESRVAPFLADGNTLLLDDIHLLEDAPEAVVWLQRRLDSPYPRWLLAGRRLPFNPDLLALLGQVTVLSQEHLAFSPEEAQLLLAQPSSVSLDWQQRVQGWPLALSLLSRLPPSLSRLPPSADPLPAARSRLFPYLATTVFDRLPPPLLAFVQATAVPLRFNRELAQAIWPEPGEAERLLDELHSRNLYVQPAELPGWITYHDLIREFLLQRLGDERRSIGGRVVDWHVAQGNDFQAIEQALDSGLTRRAAELLAGLPLARFHTDTSYLTYRRWVRALDEDALAEHPILLVRLANTLGRMVGGYLEEARELSVQAVGLAGSAGNDHTRLLAQTNLAFLDKLVGRLAAARVQIGTVLADPACVAYPRLFALRIAALIYGESGDGAAVARLTDEAIALASTLPVVNEPVMNRANRMQLYLLPRGLFAQAESEISAVLDHFADGPGWLAQYRVNLCELWTQQGDWPRLAQTLADWEGLLAQVESPTAYMALWRCHYRTVQAVVRGDVEEVQSELAEYQALAKTEYSALHLTAVEWLAVWHMRRSGDFAAAIQRASHALADAHCAPFIRPHLLLEREIAQGLAFLAGRVESFVLHSDTALLWQRRLRPQMVRLRGLLAVVCHRLDNPRWRRHWRAAYAGVTRPGYGQLLTGLDPQLGLHFWLLAVEEGLAIPEAAAALARIPGGIEAVQGLLAGPDLQVRGRGAQALALAAQEKSMPALVDARQGEEEPGVIAALEEAQEAILRTPPPQLRVQLLGGFALHRGDEPIPDSAWPRPLVRRLFQYFAVNAGVPLPTERLLEYLWPQLEPDRALRNFRTAHSLLRQVLEPYLPPKAPNRYFAVSGETYTFDPERRARIDLHDLRTALRTVVRDDGSLTGGSLPPEFLRALEGYAPVLPDLPYAEWLLECRGEMEELYSAGCYHASRSFLAAGVLDAAVHWGVRAVQAAPWREGAYRTLMRAYARRGERTAALHLYQQASERLRDELDVDPAPETVWLAERLAAGQEI